MKTNKVLILSSVILSLGAVSAQAKAPKQSKHSPGKSVSQQTTRYYEAVKHGKTTYYFSGENCYVKKGASYVKVKAPKNIKRHYRYNEQVVKSLPRGSRRVTYRGQTCYVHNGIYYRQSGSSWISFRVNF